MLGCRVVVRPLESGQSTKLRERYLMSESSGSDNRRDGGRGRGGNGRPGGGYRGSRDGGRDNRGGGRWNDDHRGGRRQGRPGDRDNYRGRDNRGGDRRDNYRGRDDHRDFRDDRRNGDNRGGDWRDNYRGRDDHRGDRRGGRDEFRGRGRTGGNGHGGRDNRNGDNRNRGYQGRDGGRRDDGRRRDHHNGPQRSGYREERINQRSNEPEIPKDVSPKELDAGIRQELRSLSKDNADKVAGHLVMAAAVMDSDIDTALAHARAAKERGGRVPITRETLGIACYHAGLWKEALTELRAARRMAGGPGLLGVMADCERGLGHPEKAIELGSTPEAADLDPEGRAELAIVIAGAHHDLGENDLALAALEPETTAGDLPDVTALRVTYAYADALELAGDRDAAVEWFTKAQKHDKHGVLDTAERLRALGE